MHQCLPHAAIESQNRMASLPGTGRHSGSPRLANRETGVVTRIDVQRPNGVRWEPESPNGISVLVLAGSSGRVDIGRAHLLSTLGCAAESIQWFDGLSTIVVPDTDAGHRTILPGEDVVSGGIRMRRGGSDAADRRLGASAWPAVTRLLTRASGPATSPVE